MAFLVMFLSETGSLRSISVTMPLGRFGHQLRDQRLLAADQDVAADEILKLADIARPVVVLHQAYGAPGEQFRCVMENFCIVIDEVVDQNRQIGDPLAQGREVDGHRIDTEEEVEPEGSVFDLVAKIAVGGRDQPGGDGAGFMAAYADESAVLQHLQQFGLNRQIKAADLVQKQRAVVRLFDPAEFGRHGARKGALFIAETAQFRAGSGGWQGS